MASEVIQMVATLNSVTGLPKDSCVNVLHCTAESSTDGDIDLVLEAVRDFYITVNGLQSFSVGSYLSDSLSRGADACSVKAYRTTDFSGETPFGSPVREMSFTMVAAQAGAPFPEEVAAVLSYNADLAGAPVSVVVDPGPPPVTIRPQKRRRGRMYIGPLQSVAGLETASIVRPIAGFRADVVQGFIGMAETINDIGTIAHLGVWSRLDEEVWGAIACHMDNAWDTQRRRGLEATDRSSGVIDLTP